MIGIFDSGLGGLTALREVTKLLPRHDIIYFGDTGRVPYGTRSRETIIRYASQDMRFLFSKSSDNNRLRAVLAACGTVSSTALDIIKTQYDIPIIGVVESAAEAAVNSTKNDVIGIMATPATIKSGAFDRAIRARRPDAKIIGVPCPLLVPLVENGYINEDNTVTRLVLEDYLGILVKGKADTVILGCTHFPIIARSIAKALGGATLINSGLEAAKSLASITPERDISETGKIECYVSDDPDNFSRLSSIFLGDSFNCVPKKISIETY